MKQLNLTILLLVFLFTSFGQQYTPVTKTETTKLMNVKNILSNANKDRASWSLYANYKEAAFLVKKADDVILDIDKYLLQTPTNDSLNGQYSEYELIKKYRNKIDTTFQGLKFFGRDQPGTFFYINETSLPIHFGMMGDTALSFIISGVFIDNIYNTLRLTSRQRATTVVTTYILPSLKAFSKSFTGNEIKYFGITCIYGSKNFADDGYTNTQPEFVAFIAPVELIKMYVAGDLTEDDLINSAEIYICDRDMDSEIKKIKITLE